MGYETSPHDDGHHKGSAKRNTVNGVIGFDANGDMVGIGDILYLTREGSEKIHIYEKTSNEWALMLIRSGMNDFTGYVNNSGAGSAIQLANMKNVGNGIVGFDASKNISIVGSQIGGYQKVHRTAVGAADYNPSALTTDYIISMTDTGAARAVVISTEDRDSGSTDNPRIIIIKDESGAAATNNITISLETAGNIDGGANVVINTNYGVKTVYLDGTNGFTI